MRTLVYGGGAVGLGLASFLLQSGAQAAVIARPETAARLREDGLRRTGIFGDRLDAPSAFAVADSLAALSSPTPFDYSLVCVKSFDTAAAARDLAAHPALWRGGRFVLVQNGWGNREAFAAAIPSNLIYNARVITGFRRPAPNHVDITVHADALRVGSLAHPEIAAGDFSAIAPLCDAIARGGFPCEPTSEVVKHIWAKILYNCALNPLGAVFGVPYGTLAEHDASRKMMDRVFDEIYAVMAAAKLATFWPTAEEYKRRFYGQMVPTTAAHHSSTLQDIRAGKRTEIDAMSGAIVALGAAHGVATPVNEALLQMVKFMESLRRSSQSA